MHSRGVAHSELGHDLGMRFSVSIHADSAATICICRRAAIGRLRHLAVQECLRRGDFSHYRIRGDANLADALAMQVPRDLLDRHLISRAVCREAGRAKMAPRAQLQPLRRENPVAVRLRRSERVRCVEPPPQTRKLAA